MQTEDRKTTTFELQPLMIWVVSIAALGKFWMVSHSIGV